MEVFQATILFSVMGLGLFFVFSFILNVITKNFIFSYLRVRASRGKLVLTEAKSETDNYYTIGKFVDKCFEYKTRQGVKKKITKVGRNNVESIMSVYKIKVDDVEDFAYTADGQVPKDMDLPDATATDTIINRIMLAAGLTDPKVLYILITVVIIAVMLIIDLVMTGQAITAAKACQTLTATIR